MRKIFLLVACSSLVAACGGGGGGSSFKDPDSVSFTYGTPAAPSANESVAVSNGADGVSGVAAMQALGSDDSSLAQDVTSLPNDIGGQLFDASLPMVNAMRSTRVAMSHRAAALLAGDVVTAGSGWDDENCWSVTAAQVLFDHCTLTSTDGTTTAVMVADGAMNRAAGHVFWDLTLSLSASGPTTGGTASLHYSDRLSGDVTFSAGSIVGFERSDVALALSAPNESVSAKLTFNVDLDLTYLADPSFCLTGGTLTGKLIWTQRPSGSTAADLPDESARFTWQDNGGACSTAVLVAWGTAN